MQRKSFKERLLELKKYKVKINVDGRRSEKTLTKQEKQRIYRASLKYKQALNDWHVSRVVRNPKTLKEFRKGHLTQGNRVWISKDAVKENDLVKLTYRNEKDMLVITRTLESGKVDHQLIPHEIESFHSHFEEVFNKKPKKMLLTVKIGDSHRWTQQHFQNIGEFNQYMPEFYAMIAERDNYESAEEVRALFEPQIHLVEFLTPYSPEYQ